MLAKSVQAYYFLVSSNEISKISSNRDSRIKSSPRAECETAQSFTNLKFEGRRKADQTMKSERNVEKTKKEETKLELYTSYSYVQQISISFGGS